MSPLRLVHIATVPQTLPFLSGQPASLRARGFEPRPLRPGLALFSRRSLGGRPSERGVANDYD